MMNIEGFAKEIRKQNQEQVIQCVLILVALCGVYLMEDVFRGNDLLEPGLACELLIAVLLGVNFHRIYLTAMDDDRNRKYLDLVVRPHTFAVKEYFSYIRKKQIYWQLAIIVIRIAAAIQQRRAVESITAIAAGIVPSLVSFVEQRVFAHRIRNRIRMAESAVLGLLRGLLMVAQVMLCFASIFALGFLGYAIISDLLAPGFDQSEVIYRNYGQHLLFWGYLIAEGLVLMLFVLERKRKFRLAAVILFAVIFVAALAEEHFCYVDTYPDRIIVSGFSGKKVYTFDQIESFAVYPEDEFLQVETTFSDGKKAKLFGGNVTTQTDGWEERYYSEYHYMAEAAPLFLKEGAVGTVREAEKLRENVKDLDTQIQEGLEQMIAVMEGERE